MYIIMDDCNTTDGYVYDTLDAARKARKAELDEIGHHMGDHLHVMTLDGRYMPEPGAWKTVDPDTGDVTFYHADSDEPHDLYDRGWIEERPVFEAGYEWV